MSTSTASSHTSRVLWLIESRPPASMTLDVYSALFDSDLDTVAEQLGKAAEDWLRTRGAKFVSLEARKVL